MRLTGGNPTNNQKGFTLVELMIVISIMGIVLAVVYQFLFFTQNSYAMADARSAVIQDVDLFFLQLEKDIRSASAPNGATKSVHILDNGQGIDIYRFNHSTNMHERISYRLNPDDTTNLQRGIISVAAQDNNANPQYASITNWETIVSNIMPGNTMIFSDSRNVDISSRRLIDVNVYIQHPDLNNSIHIQTAIMSRTGKSTASIEAYNASNTYKQVAYIKFYDDEGNEITSLPVAKAGEVLNITARAFAEDGTLATNQNLLLKQNLLSISWASFPDYSFLSGDDIGEVIENVDLSLDGYRDRFVVRSGQSVRFEIERYGTLIAWFGDPRTARLQAESPDGVSATLTIEQDH